MCMAPIGKMWLLLFSFCSLCLTGILFTLATGADSIQGSILYILSFLFISLAQNYSAKQCPHTHILTFPAKPVVSEILLCEAPEFCSDASGYR